MNTIGVSRNGESISVNIDGKRVPLLFDPIEFVLPVRTTKPTNLFFFTCSCGIPGCAGWHEGWNVYFEGESVHWERLDDDDDIGKHYQFDFAEYLAAQMNCKDMLYAIAMDRELEPFIDADGDGYLDQYGVLSFANPEDLSANINHRISWIEKH